MHARYQRKSIKKLIGFCLLTLSGAKLRKILLLKSINSSNLASCVQPVFLSLSIDPKSSVYLKGDAVNKDPSYRRLGNASGPNIQFFNSMKLIIQSYDEGSLGACILLEVDAIPIKSYWFDLLNHELRRFKRFLVVGAAPSDSSTVDHTIAQHLNGNAIYGLGDSLFKLYLEKWEQLLEAICVFKPTVCYDVACSYYDEFSSSFLINAGAYDVVRKSKDLMFDISPVILNINNSSHEEQFLGVINESTIIVHSKLYQRHVFDLL